MKSALTIILLGLFSINAYAVECKPIGHKAGKTHSLNAALHKYTHIIVPENLMEGTKPLVGNSELWEADSGGPNIYIKPTSSMGPGKETSLSVIGQSGRSYDFMVKRVKKLNNNCYMVTDGPIFTNEQRASMRIKNNRGDNNSQLATLWRDKYRTVKKQSDEDKNIAISNALRKYRYQIYTRYNWDKGGDGFIGDELISDVYDDGRFTYIRIHHQNKGLMMVEAELSGQTEIIEAKFDTVNRMYTIAGIFPKFTLKYADTEVSVSRADSKTAGEY